MADSGEGYELLQRTLWGHAANPNVGGALMIGLGCEVFQIPRMMESYALKDNASFRQMTIQAVGGTRKTVERALAVIREMLPMVNASSRDGPGLRDEASLCNAVAPTAIPASRRTPRSAMRPTCWFRRAARRFVGDARNLRRGALFNAAHIRSRGRRVPGRADPLVGGLHGKLGGNMNNNPSPGNKLGGLTTILEKSLGAAAKGGTSPAHWGLSLRRADHAQGICIHGLAWLRPAR